MSKTRTRTVLAAASAAAVIIAAVVWWVSRSPASAADRASSQDESAPRAPSVPPLPPPPAGGIKATMPDVGRLPELPLAHKEAAVKAALDGYGDWLKANFPAADAVFLGADCALEPCLIGISYSATGIADKTSANAFFKGTRAEIERRVGFGMATVHMDEDNKGRQYLWTYGLPSEWKAEDQQVLRQVAEYRHEGKIDPIRPPIPAHVPGPGEPGYGG